MISSGLYIGKVRHRRFSPTIHEFSYNTFMQYFNIAEIEETFRKLTFCSFEKWNWLSFYRKNHLKKSDGLLYQELLDYLLKTHNYQPKGKIFFLTQLACLGFCFNPISIYVIYAEGNNFVEALVLEVTNTPWHERHLYLLSHPKLIKNNIYQFEFEKKLHVSPFMEMNYIYQLNFQMKAEKLIMHINSFKNNEKAFDATLSLIYKKMNRINLIKALFKNPLTQYKTIIAIYWQALKLWAKRIPLQAHPKYKV